MNDITSAVEGIEVKHFALALDKDGKEIRVEINPKDDTPVEVKKEDA